jgi:uncharacterized membrane protein
MPTPPDVGGIFDAIFGIAIVSIVVSLAIPIIIIGVVIWAIRRSSPPRRDPAEESLRARLAAGEIGQAEFLVRMRALHDGDDEAIT